MQRISSVPENLSQALPEIVRSPLRTIVPPWSWKSATCTAGIRAFIFFASNLRSGRQQALKAMVVEAVFAVFAGGLIGAISQHLRRARPLWGTAIILCVVLPALTTLAQGAVHYIAGTPHESGGLAATFCLAAVAAAYTWIAMRKGAMLGGDEQTTVRHDLKVLPHITLDFFLIIPRLIGGFFKNRTSSL